MDPFKLLSRSTKFLKAKSKNHFHNTPSSGQIEDPQLFSKPLNSRKRKRGENAPATTTRDELGVDFFAPSKVVESTPLQRATVGSGEDDIKTLNDNDGQDLFGKHNDRLPIEECKRILTQHKVKVTWLNPSTKSKDEKLKIKGETKGKKEKPMLFPEPIRSFSTVVGRYGISKSVVLNIKDQGYTVPTEVQLGALPLLLDHPSTYLHRTSEKATGGTLDAAGVDLLTVAPTGSGKTLAFMIPLLHWLNTAKHTPQGSQKHPSAIILAPTKELVAQIVNEGRKLAQGTRVKITQVRKGMSFGQAAEVQDESTTVPAVKADILVSTPGLLQSIIIDGSDDNSATWARIQTLVLDEADVLLDPLFREQTLGIWKSLSHRDLRVSLWSATMGSNVEELARTTITERQQRLSEYLSEQVPIAPLIRLVVGLKDSAVPNVQHKLIYAATEQGKLMGLRQLLHPTTSSAEAGPPLRPPFLVFTQTIERAVALHSELLYDIPMEAGGADRIAVLHSDLSDTARDHIMTRFRKGEIWVLITTDLLSRGVDFRGINGVVNYDLPGSTAAYIHRVGRTGRAGRDGGVAVTLYSKEDIPYLKHVVNVVSIAQKQQGGDEMQQWLLDSLPRLSKNKKHHLKKHGIEARTARGKEKDAKAARKARISTKAGYVRRTDNKRRGAILGSKQRKQAEKDGDAEDGAEFEGFG